MVSKRQRGDSSKQSPPFDKARFVNFSASQRYHKWLSNKNLLPERGLCPADSDGDIAAMIQERNWELFTSQPEVAAVNVVKEFYANAKWAQGNSVFVRGKWVNVGRKALNAHYGLPKISSSEYEKYLAKPVDYNEIIQALCVPGTTWKVTTQQDAISFPYNTLNRYGKAWYKFICAKLMPSRHFTDVTTDRAALLYCIVKGKSMDVGALIHHSIVKAIDARTSGGLPNPSLLSGLCKQAGVRWDKEEVSQAPFAPINHSVIERYQVWDGGLSDPKGLGFIVVPTDPASAGPSEAATASSSTSSLIEELRRDSRRDAQQLQHAIMSLDRQNQRLAQRQDMMHAYNIDFTHALSDMFSKLHPDAASVHFPAAQTLPRYPPSDVDDEAAMHDDERSDGND